MRTAVSIVVLLVGVAPAEDIVNMPKPEADDLAAVRQIKQEISLLNLLNGLYLSSQQVDELFDLAEQAATLQTQTRQAASTESADYVAKLEVLRDGLYQTTGPSDTVEREAQQAEAATEIRPRDEMLEQLGQLEMQARNVLTDGQIAIIERFKPCLLPPKDLADPIAVGQASTTALEELILDVIRRMPNALYHQRREAIVQAVLRQGEREKGKLPDDVREGMARTLLAKLNEMRGMDDVDFDLKKTELAKDFQLFDDEVVYRHGHARAIGAVGRYLLNENACKTLKAWRAARKSDAAETDLPDVSSSSPTDRAGKTRDWILRHYEGLAFRMGKERLDAGKISRAQAREIMGILTEARQLESPDERVAIIRRVVDGLNRTGLTHDSVHAAKLWVGWLAVGKRVPGVIGHKRHPRKDLDVTGLGAIVAKADVDAEAGQFRDAIASLEDVAETLEAFKD